MRRNLLLLILTLTFFAGTLWHANTAREGSPSDETISEIVTKAFPQSSAYHKRTTPFPYIEASGSNNQILGYLLLSNKLKLGINGYGGPIPLAIALNNDGKITYIQTLTHHETLSYVGNLNNFCQQFLNSSSDSPLEIGKDIDAISRATVTSEAVTETVRASLEQFSTKILHKEGSYTKKAVSWDLTKIIFPALLFALAFTAFLLRNKTLRWLAMILGFVYFGLMTQTMLSIVQLANIGLGHIPDITKNTLWFALLSLVFISSLILGRIYCGSLCPFALIQEILFKISHKQTSLPATPSTPTDKTSRSVKYIILFLVIILCLATAKAQPSEIEPFITLFTSNSSKLAWGLVAFTLIAGVFYYRFWCIYLCPIGAATGLLSKLSLIKINPAKSCSNCAGCVDICPTSAITLDQNNRPVIDEAECILCAKCLTGCPDKNLQLGIPQAEVHGFLFDRTSGERAKRVEPLNHCKAPNAVSTNNKKQARTKLTYKHDKIFIILLGTAIAILSAVIMQNVILARQTGTEISETPEAAKTRREKLIRKFESLGLPLYEGRYWKETR